MLSITETFDMGKNVGIHYCEDCGIELDEFDVMLDLTSCRDCRDAHRKDSEYDISSDEGFDPKTDLIWE